jgi:flagellar basal body-associated protein FliL
LASVKPTPAANRPVKTTEPAEKTGSALTTIIVGVFVVILLLGLGYAFYRFLMGSGVQF